MPAPRKTISQVRISRTHQPISVDAVRLNTPGGAQPQDTPHRPSSCNVIPPVAPQINLVRSLYIFVPSTREAHMFSFYFWYSQLLIGVNVILGARANRLGPVD
jgi:hypothetical protein